MNKIQILKSGNNLTVTVRVMGSNGLPVVLNYIKNLVAKLAKVGGSSYSLSPTISGHGARLGWHVRAAAVRLRRQRQRLQLG